ncbi:hypothetical protein BR141012304_10005 [Brucella inopinata]|nr:hypothetical protein BR141012304_10005 [Brucella inopinata]
MLRGVLRSFADAAIDRTLALQENLANIDAEPLEKPEIPDLSVASAPLMRENHSERLVRALQQPFFTAGALPGCEHLIDTALLIDSQLFAPHLPMRSIFPSIAPMRLSANGPIHIYPSR